jgi:hypothetical protein
MAWLSTPSENGTITESVKYIAERLTIVWGSVSYYTRTRTITQKRFVGLTQAAAETQAGTSSVIADCVDAHTEATGGGSYAALETIDSVTDWTPVVPAAPAPGAAAARQRTGKRASLKGN